MNDDSRNEIRRLEELVARAAGAMAFPVLAEAHRRAGRPEAAERCARAGLEHAPEVSAGRIALALALLDQKRVGEAMRELERLLGGQAEHAVAADMLAAQEPEGVEPAPRTGGEIATLDPYPLAHQVPASAPFAGSDVEDDELDAAFEEAESDRDQMIGADDVAQAALAAVAAQEDTDPGLVPASADPEEAERALDPGGPFATETVAGLLERQGHAQEAGRIRERLVGQDDDGPLDEAEGREDAPAAGHAHRATLERWLENLRRHRE